MYEKDGTVFIDLEDSCTTCVHSKTGNCTIL